MSFWGNLAGLGALVAGEVYRELSDRKNHNKGSDKSTQSGQSTASMACQQQTQARPRFGGEIEGAEDKMMELIECLRYPGEVEDRKLLLERYQLNAFLDAMEQKSRETCGSVLDQALAKSKYIDAKFLPRVYKIAEFVLDNLKLGYQNIRVQILPPGIQNAYVSLNVNEDENGQSVREFTFVLSSAYLQNGYTDSEIAFLFGIRLYEYLYQAYRFAELIQISSDGDDEDQKCVLPPLAGHVLKRIYYESFLSMDRIGLIANGLDVNAAFSCLIKDTFDGTMGNDLVIPDEQSLSSFDETLGFKVLPANEITELSFMPTRFTALHRFGVGVRGAEKNGPNSLERLNEELKAAFEGFEIGPDPDEDAESFAVMQGIATVGLDLILQNESPREIEIRRLLQTLLGYTSRPEHEIVVDSAERAKRREAALSAIRKSGEGALIDFEKGLVSLAMTTGSRFETCVNQIVELVTHLGLDATLARHVVNAEAKNLGSVTDPVLDDYVFCACARLENRPEPAPPCLPPLVMKEPATITEKVRYSDDIERERLLGELYHLDMMVAQSETVRKAWASSSVPEECADKLHFTKQISPRVERIIKNVRSRLQYPKDVGLEVFCENSTEMNACAYEDVTEQGRCGIVVLNSRVLEELDDDEVASVIGHELGHVIYRHGRWHCVERDSDSQQSMLPFMGDRLYWEWRQRCEISADRAGAIAAGNAASAITGLLKVCYGLSPKNIDVNVDVLLSQLEQVQKAPELASSFAKKASTVDHPIDPLRMNALKAFCDVYYGPNFSPEKLKGVDEKIAASYELIRRQPRTEEQKAVAEIVSLAGLQLLKQDDGRVSRAELTELVKILFSLTDTPIDELTADETEQDVRLRGAVKVLRESDDETKEFVLRALVRLAYADGSLSAAEAEHIRRFAQVIRYPYNTAHVISDVVSRMGMPIDFIMESNVRKIRKALCKNKQHVPTPVERAAYTRHTPLNRFSRLH